MTKQELAAHSAWDAYYTALQDRSIPSRGQGNTVHGSRYFKAFMGMAEFCLEHGYDARDYVVNALDMVLKRSRYITPKDLNTVAIKKLYEELVQQRGTQSSAEKDWQQQQVFVQQLMKCHPDVYTTVESVLLASALSFDAWFRVFYPEQASERLLARYGDITWQELHTNPQLRVAMQRIRPATYIQLQDEYGYFGGLEDWRE